MIAYFLGTNREYLITLADSFADAQTIVISTEIDHLCDLKLKNKDIDLYIVMDGTMLSLPPERLFEIFSKSHPNARTWYFYKSDSRAIRDKLDRIGFDKVITSKEEYFKAVSAISS